MSAFKALINFINCFVIFMLKALGINYNLCFFISYKRLNGIDNLSCIGNTPFHQGLLPQPIQDKLSKVIANLFFYYKI